MDSGNLVSCSNDKTVKIWNVINGTILNSITHTHWVYSIAFLSNGYLVSGLYDGTINILNLETNQLIRNLIGHTKAICSRKCLHVLDNGDLLSASYDNCLKVWNSNDETVKLTSSLHKSQVNQLVVLSNRTILVVRNTCDPNRVKLLQAIASYIQFKLTIFSDRLFQILTTRLYAILIETKRLDKDQDKPGRHSEGDLELARAKNETDFRLRRRETARAKINTESKFMLKIFFLKIFLVLTRIYPQGNTITDMPKINLYIFSKFSISQSNFFIGILNLFLIDGQKCFFPLTDRTIIGAVPYQPYRTISGVKPYHKRRRTEPSLEKNFCKFYIVRYEYFALDSNDSNPTALSYGKASELTTQLPQGLKSNLFRLYILVQVIDDSDAITAYLIPEHVTTVRVEEGFVSKMSSELTQDVANSQFLTNLKS
ncbi:serine threonine kinase [Brachionus plicatilis]|uniref:Serine threonine kinase n=1 Tax=Brachionus plicatilis TaxID=10195 RepID=A0A3M7RKE5_BRAPC|nr:serine threonine kinase [Brachionus plicatilis]